ncbi:MAG: hypothetical protein EXS05_01295 [Planctomycetaceae bacterium]|nr:hypothetical protein [Planctomycetaceae bacterium]
MTSFWFAPEGPRRLALMRIGLGLVMLCEMVPRWRSAIELYSTLEPPMPMFADRSLDTRPVDRATSTIAQQRNIGSFRLPIPSPIIAIGMHTLLLFALLGVVLGWQTRTSLIGFTVLFAWLGLLDGAATFAKQSVIALHLGVLLACSGCGRAWSFDALSENRPAALCHLSPAWPRRLMQVLVCAIYFGAAITKLKNPSYLSGDLLGFSLLDDHWGGGRLGLWLSTQPRALLLLSLATLLFELLFPVLIWVSRLRWPLLAAAAAFHLGMAATLHLQTFSPMMFVALAAFLREGDLSRLRFPGCNPVRDKSGLVSQTFLPAASTSRNRFGLEKSATIYAAAAIVTVCCGVLIQHHYDWYAAFGRRPLAEIATLSPITPRDLAEMRSSRLPAWEDYIHRVAIGSRTGGTQVFGSSDRFHIGENVYVVVQLLPQHPDLTLEGLLIAPDGREAARFTHRIARDYTYAIDGFELTGELPPGRYRLLLQVEGFEFARRQFEVRP